MAGTCEYQGWHGIAQAEKFAAILKDYPEVILFSGHSHWQMESAANMKERDDKLPTIFNTASVAYLWSDAQACIEGAQGYYVKVYEDKVLVLGRDFGKEQWLASAQYLVQYGSEPPVEPEKPGSSSDVSSPTTGASGVLPLIVAAAAMFFGMGIYILCKTKKASVKPE